MKAETIKNLIEKYYAGETTLEEELLLREFFLKEENKKTDPEFAELIQLFQNFEQVELESENQLKPITDSPKGKVVSFPWYYSMAAAVAFLLIGFWVGHNIQTKKDDSRIAQLSGQIEEIKSMMSYQQVRNLSPTDKIQIAYDAQEFDSTDYKSIDVLIDLMFFDENVNVRLAATEALTKFGKSEKVRNALVDALKKETDPMIQIKLIDALVKSKEIKALPEFQKIIDSQDINSAVKQRAAMGINQLI